MKKITVLYFLLVGIYHVQAQNAKNIVFDANAEVRSVKGFTGVEVSGAIDLYLSQGKEEAVAISASNPNSLYRIKTEVRNGKLHIYFDGNGWTWKTWSNNNKTVDVISSDNLKIQLSGASDFTGEVKAGKLRLDASGASNFKVSGSAENTTVDLSGACEMKAYDLKAEYAKIEATGASAVRITINKELSAEASGGSTIFYKGAGVVRDISSSGGATIKRKSDD